jgi:4-hydroxy 2-oxovalerate aldolase
VKILDCTLRDGGYYNNWDFSVELIQEYISAMESVGIDFIEFGFRFTPKDKFLGACAYSTDNFIQQFCFNSQTVVGVMLNASDYIEGQQINFEALNFAFPNNAADSIVKLVRVACHFNDFKTALPISNYLVEKGYRVGFNIMQIGEQTLPDIELAAKFASDFPLEVLYFADSLGNLTPEHTRDIIHALKKGWKGELGIHTHDNLGNAIANTLTAVKEGVTWLDATVTGMGRGPGNAQTELLILALGDRWKQNPNVVELFKLVANRFKPMKERYGWGTNPFYFLAGQFGIHPSYIQEMLEDNRYDEEDILAVIDYLKTIDSRSFSVQNLELGKNIYREPIPGSWNPAETFSGKEVLILGTGPGLTKHKKSIEQFIEKYKPIVLALNAKEQIKDDLIDFRLACQPVRLLSDIKEYARFNQPVIMPKSALSDYLQAQLSDKIVLDYGLGFQSNTMAFYETHCILPTTLVAAYALAVANSGKARKIYLAGFDGYGKGDVRQIASENIFKTYLALGTKVPISSLLNTSYNITSESVYTKV